MPDNSNIRGIAMMALAFFWFAAADTLAKVLTDTFHPLQIVWLRIMGLFLGVCVLIIIKSPKILKTTKPALQILRGVCAVGSGTCFIIAVAYVPLADAVAVTFVAPFMVTILGAVILKEPVGIRRWLAVAIGFFGMLIVIRPGMGVLHPSILLVVVAAVFFAFRQLLSRWLSGVDSIQTTIAYTSITAFLLTSLAMPFVWVQPVGTTIYWQILGLAVLAAIGEIFIIRALDIAQSVVLAPVHYSLIIWSTIYGFLVFNELPDQWTLLGCIIIVISGLYTLYREHLIASRSLRTS